MSGEPAFLRGKLPYLIIGLIGIAVYFSSLFFGFVYLDDNGLILQAHRFQAPGNFWQVFRYDVFNIASSNQYFCLYYRPLLMLSFMLDAQWGGPSAFYFHLTNLLIHLGAVFLLFIFLQKIHYKRELAFLGALIFTVHPVLVSAVAWIPGRNDSLLTLFSLASFIFFIAYAEKGKVWDGLCCMMFLFLALLTKESALALPVIFLFYLCCISKHKMLANKTYLAIGGWAVTIGAWYCLRQAVDARMLGPGIASMLKGLLVNWPAFIQGLGKIFFPFNLAVAPSVGDTTLFYGLMASFVLLCLLAFNQIRRYNFIFFGFFWFGLFLLPSQVVVSEFFMESRFYLPLVGIIIVLLETDAIGKLNSRKWGAGGIGVLIGLLIVINLFHAEAYRNRLTFWRAAAHSSLRSAMAHLNLGQALYLQGENEEAFNEFKRAHQLDPAEPDLHNSLGVLYMDQKKWTEAENEFKQELKNGVNVDLALLNLGNLYACSGRGKLAPAYWKKALAINPERIDAYKNLVYYYYLVKDLKQAEYYLDQLKTKGILIDLKTINRQWP